jgi:uncharacterized protein (DUF4415 family)
MLIPWYSMASRSRPRPARSARRRRSPPPAPAAAVAVAVSQVMVTLPIDADLLAYFQRDTEPPNWQGRINDLLRFFVETNQAIEADWAAEAQRQGPEPQPDC